MDHGPWFKQNIIFDRMNAPSQKQIFSISNEQQFADAALQAFRFQAHHNTVYRQFIDGLNIDVTQVTQIDYIPFLPISFFKSHHIVSNAAPVELVFTSSGTTGIITSSHYVSDASWYRESFRRAFRLFYGDITNYCVLALLPAYLEREGSSLIYMAQDMITESQNPDSGFYLYNHTELHTQLKRQQENGQPTLLIGVTFALLDFAEQYAIHFPELIVMETGGMKGRRKEMIREELHHVLCKGFGVNSIHSEYGMTELLSQAYSKGEGLFNCPPWMRVLTRDTNDPLSLTQAGRTGGINIIDLANINSCCFIATQDLGRVAPDSSFEVLGRFDHSDIRGCNLLVG